MEPYQSKWVDDSSHSFNIGRSHELVPLSESDVELDDMPDIEDWDVMGSDGKKIGEVQDLIIDPAAKEARYLDVLAEEELSREEARRRLLIPIGAANINEDDKKVTLEGVSYEQLRKCPPFKGCPITQEFAKEVHVNMGPDQIQSGSGLPSPGTDYNDEDFFRHMLYDGGRVVKKKKED